MNRHSAWLGATALLSWLGLYVHNVVDLPGLTPASPENSSPALLSALLVAGWWLLPRWRRAFAALLLGWGLVHLVVGALLSVLPLPIWPFVPAQTSLHYAMHLLYGLSQLPLHWLAVRLGRRARRRDIELIHK